MRFLQCSEAREFCLTQDSAGDEPIPSYAMLSHTWGQGEEEVTCTFQDMINGTRKDKLGYKRSASVDSRQSKIDCSISRSIPVVLARKTKLSSSMLAR